MNRPCKVISLISLAAFALSLEGADLSKYRNFQLGMPFADVATAISQPSVKVIATRPERLKELDWQVGWLPESAKPAGVPFVSMAFAFYNGALYQIRVSYDRRQTEGLTDNDMVESISSLYGRPSRTSGPSNPDAIALWEDARSRISLIRLPYYAGFGLILSSQATLVLAEQARLASARMDQIEAPMAEAALQAKRLADAQLANEKARSVNKPGFRP